MKSKKCHALDIRAFLERACGARRIVEFQKNQVIFSQGGAAKNVMYLQKGVVHISIELRPGRLGHDVRF